MVEDNAVHAEIIRRHLSKAAGDRLTLSEVDCLKDAFQSLATSGIDAVLLDLSLPDSEITETLPRFIEAHDDVPVVVLTSLNDLDFATQAVQQGAQDYLVKSDLGGELLLRSIRYAIERKKTQDKLESYAVELQRSNEHLKAFAHTVAHEVKSPLTAVSACLQMLEQDHRDKFDDDRWEIVRTAATAARGMAQVVNDLLDFSRIGGGQQNFETVDLETAFYQAYAAQRPAIKQSGAVVTHDALPHVRGNEVQLRQLLINLIGNAIKYRSDRSPEIHVGCDEGDDQWTVTVRDNGTGIAAENCERIFEAFVRLQHADRIPGSGIGLAICKRIVENHDGRIWVESVPGEGSTFLFTLPKITGAS